MMTKTKLAVLISALLWGGAAAAITAAPVVADQQFVRDWGVHLLGATIIAKHGADDPADPFDDNGVDLLPKGAATIAKHGADDPADPFDDNGVDLLPKGATILAREAGEGPRGGDNERAGDRQRRGGRGLIDEA